MADLAGAEVHPDVVHLFMECSAPTGFWLDLTAPGLGALLLREGPLRAEPMGFEELKGISDLFSIIIDFRSGFTATHCAGVIACAGALGEYAGMAGRDLDALLLAANLHDIGKLVIHNEILEKGGALTAAEKQIMRQHPYVTFRLLNQVEGLEQVARIAGYHHERLDGGGYPFGIGAAGLDLPCRIMAVADIFTALAENRPYRSGLDRLEVGSILQACAGRGWLDPDLVGLVIRNMGDMAAAMAANQEVWRERYQETWREPAMAH
jgi:HD-GYP domain-containing protein (c-di-GMP phosphodiesterase class II)